MSASALCYILTFFSVHSVTVKELTVTSLIRSKEEEEAPEKVVGVTTLDKSNQELKVYGKRRKRSN